jgi:hypothetical protein
MNDARSSFTNSPLAPWEQRRKHEHSRIISRNVNAPERTLNRSGDSGDCLVWVCYWKAPVSPISRAYLGVTGDFVAQPNCQNVLFSRYLRCLEYASSNQGVGGSNPSGRTKITGVLSGHIGKHFCTEGVFGAFDPAGLVIEEA